jgi:hypothetical protein
MPENFAVLHAGRESNKRGAKGNRSSMRYRLRTLMICLAILPPMGRVVLWLYRGFDPTAAATMTLWLVVGLGLACAALARWDRPI